MSAGEFGQYITRYTVYANGQIDLGVTFAPASGDIRRLGLSMQLPEGLDKVEYYARGPWANYIDRKNSTHLGVFNTTVDGFHELFVNPQTMGGREDLRYVRCRILTAYRNRRTGQHDRPASHRCRTDGSGPRL